MREESEGPIVQRKPQDAPKSEASSPSSVEAEKATGPKILHMVRIDPIPKDKAALIQLSDCVGSLYVWPVKAKSLRDAMWEVMEHNQKGRRGKH